MTINTLTAVGGFHQVAAEDRTTYERTLLKALFPNQIFADYGDKKSIPMNGGRTLQFRRFERIAPLAVPVPLNSGVTPAGKPYTVTPITVTPDQYGDVIYITDRLQLQGIDDNILNASEILGKLAGETFDIITRNVVITCGAIQYQGGKALNVQLDNTCKATVAGFARAARTLKKKYCLTETWNGFFIAIISPDVSYDLQQDPQWIEAKKLGMPQAITDGEVGAINKVRFVESTAPYVNAGAGAAVGLTGVQTTGGSADVHYSPVIAKGAYGVVDVAGQSMRPRLYVKSASESGTFDPIEQRSSVGYKGMLGAVELDSNRMVVVRSTVSL